MITKPRLSLDLPMAESFRPGPPRRPEEAGTVQAQDNAEVTHLATDPVCGMKVDPHKAKHQVEHGGRTYYFCSAGCKDKFLANPQRYLAPKVPPQTEGPLPGGTIYTCPMHPEIRQIGPGSCP